MPVSKITSKEALEAAGENREPDGFAIVAHDHLRMGVCAADPLMEAAICSTTIAEEED